MGWMRCRYASGNFSRALFRMEKPCRPSVWTRRLPKSARILSRQGWCGAPRNVGRASFVATGARFSGPPEYGWWKTRLRSCRIWNMAPGRMAPADSGTPAPGSASEKIIHPSEPSNRYGLFSPGWHIGIKARTVPERSIYHDNQKKPPGNQTTAHHAKETHIRKRLHIGKTGERHPGKTYCGRHAAICPEASPD